jgi:hypothetical protein
MRNALLLVILVATAACGAYRFPGPGNGSGTVSGQVIASQCGPVQPAAQPCIAGPPAKCLPNDSSGPSCGEWPVAGLELVFTNGSDSRSAKTDSGGNYSIQLPSGTWTVGTASYTRIIKGPRIVVVDDGPSIVANYVIDTGMRAAA